MKQVIILFALAAPVVAFAQQSSLDNQIATVNSAVVQDKEMQATYWAAQQAARAEADVRAAQQAARDAEASRQVAVLDAEARIEQARHQPAQVYVPTPVYVPVPVRRYYCGWACY